MRAGFIGLGSMGFPMAGHILERGEPGDSLVVTDTSPARIQELAGRGAIAGANAREVAAGSDVVQVMVPDVPHIRAVLEGPDGLLAGADHPLVLVISSTISAEAVREIAAEAAAANPNVRVVDAPVSGGEVGAKAGTLSLMVGGADEDVSVALLMLQRLGRPVHLGPLGAGQVAKACNQLICAATIASVAEASVVAERAGLDVGQLFDLLAGGYAGSRIMDDKGPRYAAKDYSVSGAAWLWIKDLQAYLSEASATGTPTLMGDRLLAAFQGLTDADMGGEDTAVIQKWIAQQSPASP